MKKKILWGGLISAAFLLGTIASNGSGFDPAPLARHNRFIAEYITQNEYVQHGSDLNVQICEEGFTLLKNLDNVLPLEGVERVSMFGKSSVDPAKGGGGSGSGGRRGETTAMECDLQKSLEEAGYVVNPELVSFYKSNSRSEEPRTNGNSGWKGISEATVGETSRGAYERDATVMASFAEYHDAAIVLFAREGTEGADCKTWDARDHKNSPATEEHILKLSENESDLLDMIEEDGFDKIIVLINSGNIFQCDRFETDDKISAVLWVGTPGCAGFRAVGRILNGDVNPSGHTVDTWTRDFTHDPSFQNFADNCQTNEGYANCTMLNPDGSPVRSQGTYKGDPKWEDEEHYVVEGGLNGVKPAQYISYEEGVYVDYRYYETKYADMEAASKGSGDDWYAGEYGVIYPFGYGLSYTSFTQSIVSCDIDENTVLTGAKKRINVTVKVENTGDVTGKDVVQLYWKAPYINGEIEKPYEILCAFDKTDDIEPGESQEVKLEFYIQDQAVYDCFDANKNGFCGYELDGGEYAISLNKNAHEVYETRKFRVQKNGIKYENDRFTGHKVENRFTDRGFYSSLPGENDVGFDQFSRADFDATFPSAPTIEDRKLKEGSRVQEYFDHAFTLADIDVYGDYDYVPEAAHKTKEDIEALGWEQPATALPKADRPHLDEMIGIPNDDPRWTEFMNTLTFKEMQVFIEDGTMKSPGLDSIDKPQTGEGDGPSQFKVNGSVYWAGAPIVAATYNVRLAQQQGECVGIEAHIGGQYGWWGPAVNIHRSPFGGRNFEYYSADPFLMGRMAAKVVEAATERGIYCYFKHFAVNDQEKGREGVCAFLTEQALREIYLRPFQMVFEEGKSVGVMSSYNRMGLMETAASYPLLTEVLREEWGFKGDVLSDMAHRGNGAFNNKYYENVNNRVLAGCNAQLETSQKYTNDIQAKWDPDEFDGKGAPIYTFETDRDVTYDGEDYEEGEEITCVSYSWWYAARLRAQEILYVYCNCGAMDKQLVRKVDGCIALDEEQKLNINEAVSLEVEPGEGYGIGGEYNGKEIEGYEIELDFTTPLPDGLEFSEGKIVGTPTKLGQYKVHVLLTLNYESGSDLIAARIIFNIIDPADEDKEVPVKEDEEEKKNAEGCGGSCGGSVAAASVIVMAIALASVRLISKKRED